MLNVSYGGHSRHGKFNFEDQTISVRWQRLIAPPRLVRRRYGGAAELTRWTRTTKERVRDEIGSYIDWTL